MRLTWNWLGELVELDWPLERLTDCLTAAGLEVESVEPLGRDLAGVRCVEVVGVAPHPHAAGLRVCEIRAEGTEVHTVVCGAPNVAVGARAAWAPPGTTLPGGRRIGTLEIHGVASAGMLCSEAELGIGTDAGGILLLPGQAVPGTPVAAVLGLEDTVLDVAVTPNRGDCLSVLGLAREVAALTGQRLIRRRPRLAEVTPAAASLASVHIADADLCGRYVARVLTDLAVGPSPPALRVRLQAVGVRPINNVVDATNYVMVERGQPLHAFDLDRLPRPEIVVRRAGQAGAFVTLDGQERLLQPNDLLITSGGQAVALAGVMGGANSEVTPETRRVLLESAWFDPGAIRRTARRLGLQTEASYRFERCTDIEGVPGAADRAAELMAALAGGRVLRGTIDVYPAPRAMPSVPLRLKRLEDLLGLSVGRAEVAAKLKALGVTVTPAPRGTLVAVPPSWRPDLTREIDLIEEVARLIGYDNIPTTVPGGPLADAADTGREGPWRDIRRFLAAQGLHEALFLGFASAEMNRTFPGFPPGRQPVRLRNPLSAAEAEMRLSLCGHLVEAVRENLARGARAVALFSLGKVFWSDETFRETWRCAGVVCRGFPGAGLGRRETVDFADIKGVVEALLDHLRAGPFAWRPAAAHPTLHPGLAAEVVADAGVVGLVGALHPDVRERLDIGAPCWVFELDLPAVLHYVPRRLTFAELPRFPAVVRDVAFVVEDGFASGRLAQFLRTSPEGSGLVESVELFDEYVGPPIAAGRKSLAYTIAYRANDRTLTDAEVSAVHDRLIGAAVRALGIELR